MPTIVAVLGTEGLRDPHSTKPQPLETPPSAALVQRAALQDGDQDPKPNDGNHGNGHANQ